MTMKTLLRTRRRAFSPKSVTCLPDDLFDETDQDSTVGMPGGSEVSSQCETTKLPKCDVDSSGKLGKACIRTAGVLNPWNALYALFFVPAEAVIWKIAIIALAVWDIRRGTQAMIPPIESPPSSACPKEDNQEDSSEKVNINDVSTESCDDEATAKPLLSSLPENTFAIAIDDSNLQRKLLGRYMKLAGVSEEKRLVLGGSTEEIYSFVDRVVGLVREHDGDVFLLIVDENLDIFDGPTKGDSVSGSLCVQTILNKLSPEENGRVLALVRSANDSPKDLERYTERAHGYILKKPIKNKAEALDVISPWWTKRFTPNQRMCYVAAQA